MMPQIQKSLCLLTGLLLFAVGSTNADEYSFEYQRIIEIDKPVTLTMDVLRSNVTVVGGEDSRLIIEATKRIRGTSYAEAEDVAAHVEIKVEKSSKEVKVSTNYLRILDRKDSFWRRLLGATDESYGSVDFRVILPLGCSIAITGIDASVNLSSIEGSVVVENTSGSLKGSFLFGSVTIQQPTGKILLDGVEGDVRIKSNSATIDVQQYRGALDVETLSGDVTIRTELASMKDFLIETTTGQISLYVPESSSGSFDIETGSGEITARIPISIRKVSRGRLEGDYGDGGAKITLQSFSGDVFIANF
jgi:DUF4097 and DUF4098 domain-containing protein YvlB